MLVLTFDLLVLKKVGNSSCSYWELCLHYYSLSIQMKFSKSTISSISDFDIVVCFLFQIAFSTETTWNLKYFSEYFFFSRIFSYKGKVYIEIMQQICSNCTPENISFAYRILAYRITDAVGILNQNPGNNIEECIKPMIKT